MFAMSKQAGVDNVKFFHAVTEHKTARLFYVYGGKGFKADKVALFTVKKSMSDEKFKDANKSQAALDNMDMGVLLYAHSQPVLEAEVDAMKAHYVTKERTMSETDFDKYICSSRDDGLPCVVDLWSKSVKSMGQMGWTVKTSITNFKAEDQAYFQPEAVANALLVLRRVFNAPWIQESDIQLCLREDAKTFKSTIAVGTPEALAEKVTSEYWRSMCITNITKTEGEILIHSRDWAPLKMLKGDSKEFALYCTLGSRNRPMVSPKEQFLRGRTLHSDVPKKKDGGSVLSCMHLSFAWAHKLACSWLLQRCQAFDLRGKCLEMRV